MQGLFAMHKREREEHSSSGERRSKHQKQQEKRESHLGQDVRKPAANARSNSDSRDQKAKVLALIAALDDVLDEGTLAGIEQYVDRTTINQSLELRTALRKRTNTDSSLSTPPSSFQKELNLLDSKNIPKLISGLSITGWKSSELPITLPTLPPIFNEHMEKAVFTHNGTGIGRITDLNYERLEWVGDAYMELIATLLISQTFPFHTPGQCAQLRESLVKNVTLAGYTRAYGLDKRTILPEAFHSGRPGQATSDLQIKVLGDTFEAYVAAVVLSDPKYGLSRAVHWLKELWGMDLAKEIAREEKTRNPKLLSHMWDLGYTGEVDQQDPSLVPPNPKDQLQKALGAPGIKLSYNDAAPEQKDKKNKLPIFTVGVYLDGWGEKGKQLGIGSAHGKKEAGFKAAEMALKNKKMMKVYTDKKSVHDAQKKMEAEALANLETS